MSHGITERDGVFAVRDAGWHGLAKSFDGYPTRQEAQEYAHGWEPITEPVYRKVIEVQDHNGWGEPVEEPRLIERYEPVEGFNAVVRSDLHNTLGVVSDTYVPVNNSEMYDIAEAIEGGDPASVRYETGGSLHGGRKVWLLLRLAEPLIIKGDNGPTIPYFGLQNAFDGSGAFRGQALMTKIICDNTSQAADIEAEQRGTEFAFSHTKNVRERIEQARQALAGWKESVREYRLICEHMITERVTEEQREWFIDSFIPEPPPHMASDRVMGNVHGARNQMRSIFVESPTLADISLTQYGLVQGAIEYNQHFRKARSNETRFKRAYLDRSTITSDALALAQEAVKV